jgi:hypothetical protein
MFEGYISSQPSPNVQVHTEYLECQTTGVGKQANKRGFTMPALSPPSGLEERDCRGFMTLENKVDRQGRLIAL